jgi:hypothetical protein
MRRHANGDSGAIAAGPPMALDVVHIDHLASIKRAFGFAAG